jgi:toxin ParE1/3/4
MAEVVLRAEAITDIIGIQASGIEQFGPETAARYLAGLELAISRLGAHPLSGPLYPGIRPPIRYLAYRRHHIFYDTDGETVWIVRILHHAQEAGRLL